MNLLQDHQKNLLTLFTFIRYTALVNNSARREFS